MNIYPSGSLIANRYEVAGRPLLGGMGIVYLCMDRQEDRPVALKTFQPQFLPDRASRDRFLREGTTWVDLGRHPHIVRCYNIDRIGDGREVFLSLELVAQEQGRRDASLRSWLTPGQALPVEQSLLFALQIARGMRHACQQIPGFVHRDLKPENILVGADKLPSLGANRLRVTDFGLANILSVSGVSAQASGEIDASENLSRTQLTHGIVGTPLYMAPEQWQAGELGAWTDIYALGCILYEMLSGERAVSGKNLKELEKAHCAGQARALLPDLPAVVQDLVADCLRLAPGERYQEWGSLESALGAAWETLSAQALSPAEAPQGLDREERIAVGWSYSNMGASYLDIGKADVARDYFERARSTGRSEGERTLEGAALGNLGLAYADLGDFRRAIGFHEQALEISREIGDRLGAAMTGANLGMTFAQIGEVDRAITLVGEAVLDFNEAGYPQQAQQAERMLAQIQRREAPGTNATQADSVQAAFEAFQRVGSIQEMQVSVAQFPFMTEDGFIDAIEKIIQEQVPPEQKPAFKHRLDWLRHIDNEQKPGLLSRLFRKREKD